VSRCVSQLIVWFLRVSTLVSLARSCI